MSLQFILGPSGSGKTEYIYGRIVKEAGLHPDKNYLVIVPEQFTLQTQQKLVELAPGHAIMNIDVLSFKRLAYRVFDELGKTDLKILDETGKNLVLRRLAQKEEESLTVLRPNMSRMGYIGEVKSLISELVQYNISPEELQKLAEDSTLPQVLRAKLGDVCAMYTAFEDFLEGTCMTAEEILHVLRDLADRSALLRGSVILLDEFTGFTPIQNDLLRQLLCVSEKIYVTLTIDDQEDFYHSRGSEELFDLSKRTIASLMKMAGKLQVEVQEPVVLSKSQEKRFVKSPSLAFLEQNLFRPKAGRMEEKPEEIHLSVTVSPREELVLIARKINELVRKGYRYREIAVVTGSVETYKSYVEPVFTTYEIPYFLDTTQEVLFHPFIEMIRAALEIVACNYSYEAVIHFLRCGFCGITEEDIDRLDNYLLATGIRGHKAWSKRFVHTPKQKSLYDLEHLEELRVKIFDLLEPFWQVFERKDALVKDGILAVYGMFTALDCEQQLWDKEQSLLEEGQQTKSREYGQIYKIIVELLEKYYDFLGEEELEIEEFSEILDAGLSAATVASVPPGYDCVTIGDIERTRLNHIKILFFAGVNDGIIPKEAKAGGIISEYERELLLSREVELAPGAREQAFVQRFYLYRNLTKPSEQLYVSFAKSDREGHALRPSYLIAVLQKLFPAMAKEEYEEVEAQPDFYTKEAAFSYLIHGKRDEDWYGLAHHLLQEEGRVEKQTRQLLEAPYVCYEEEPISRAVALALYGRKPAESITKLERFAACAYSHFLAYGLQLKEREKSSFEGVDMGNIYHDALERYSRKLQQSKYDWFGIPDEERVTMAEDAIGEALEACPNMGLYATAENTYQAKRMRDIFQQTVWALTKQVRAGKFVPDRFELSFSELEDVEALSYALPSDVKMRLVGRIDRIDTYKEHNQISIKIIDYKSGNAQFDMVKLYRGLSLQLVVYLDAAMELMAKEHPDRELLPGGILYYHIDDPVLTDEGNLTEKEAEQELLKALRPDGIVNDSEGIYRAMDENLEGRSEVIPVELKKSGDLSMAHSHVASTEEFQVMEQYSRGKIAEIGRDIYGGKVGVNPYRYKAECSCTYCPYGAVCGVKSRIPGYEFRDLETMKKEDVLDLMRTDNAKNEVKDQAKEIVRSKADEKGRE